MNLLDYIYIILIARFKFSDYLYVILIHFFLTVEEKLGLNMIILHQMKVTLFVHLFNCEIFIWDLQLDQLLTRLLGRIGGNHDKRAALVIRREVTVLDDVGFDVIIYFAKLDGMRFLDLLVEKRGEKIIYI